MTINGEARSLPAGVLETLETTLSWSRDRDFAGYSKHDALNSPLLGPLSFNNRTLRLLYIQGIMRFPVNLRPVFAVPPQRNPKGIGLFAHALLDLADVSARAAARDRVREAEDLLRWLKENPSPWTLDGRLEGLGWGYHYPWQDVGFFQPRHYPNRVVTCWIGFAFLRAFEVTSDNAYLKQVGRIVSFLLENPKALVDTGSQLCLSYVPSEEIEWAVMDVSALCAALCAWAARHGVDRPGLADTARRLMTFAVDKQTDYGAWFYTWPAGDSHIRHDNYHTGIILDCIADYMTFSGDRSFEGAYREGLAFYRKHLFLEDGSPRWMNDRTWPKDVHGAAAGILAFTRAAAFFPGDAEYHQAFADRILAWTMGRLYDARGYFYYQQTRFFTKRFCLMRWGNAWMARALAQAIRYRGEAAATRPSNVSAS